MFKKKEEKPAPKPEAPKTPPKPRATPIIRFSSPLDVIDKMLSNLRYNGAMNRDEERLEKILTSNHRNNTWQYTAVKIAIEYLMKMKVIK